MKSFQIIFLIIVALAAAIGSEDSFPNNIAFVEIGSYVGDDIAKKYYAPRYYTTVHANAQAICHSYHMNLVMIESNEEFEAVSGFCKKFPDLLQDWVLVDGTTLSSKSPTDWYYTRTGNKIPFTLTWAKNGAGSFLDDLNGDERCLTLGPQGVYEFNDFPCNINLRRFLCEKKAYFKSCS